jgi:hypothetical protein
MSRQRINPIVLFFFILWAVMLLVFAVSMHAAPKTPKGQKQPDAKRVAELQAALKENGYEPGKTWAETKEVLRRIADDHGWQNMWAPDARVLGCVLHLGNGHFDPSICDQPGNVLDQDERKWVEQHGSGKVN